MSPSHLARRRAGLALAAMTLPLLGACAASATPGWDAHFGDSVRTLMAQQIRNPDAGKRARPTASTDAPRPTRSSAIRNPFARRSRRPAAWPRRSA